MEATPSLAPRALSSQPSKREIFRQYIPPNAATSGSGNSSKHFSPFQPNGVHGQNGTPGIHSAQSVAPGSIPNGIDAGDQSMNYGTHDLVTETNATTPIDSVSTPFPSSSSNGKSTPPSTVVNFNSLPTALGSSSIDGAPDYSRYRPRSSIPARLPAPIYAQQCIAAAYASRLNPYALHHKEQEALQDHLCHLHVTVYLNIRNAILRLWTRNPMVSVSKEEALGCAKDYRWMNLASFAYEWLIRHGYINFGCLEIPMALIPPKKGRRRDGPVIVVIGAGMAGLGCARQLEGFFNHFRDSSNTPRVVVLEGRRRIGGRIYSHPLRSLQTTKLPPGLTPKAEMGAQIVVGFDHGNPLDQIIRGQLALSYHLLRDVSTIYDVDGSPVDEVRDATAESLYNDVLDRSGDYRHKNVILPTAEGDRDLIDSGRDVSTSDGVTVRQYEEARAAGTIGLLLPAKRIRRGVGHKTTDIKSAAVPAADPKQTQENPATVACQAMGWKLNEGMPANPKINLDPIAKESRSQTLGNAMDEGVRQYQGMLPLTPKDLRLLNWHFANLEYANATNIGNLSLSGWDQDMGNEFEGEHSQVIGGYNRVPYGLWSHPSKLNVQTNKTVTGITYDATGSNNHKTLIYCEDGDSIAADMVVYTGSLGTLKHRTVDFSPPLPGWKQGAIDRLGFGVMNKVILTFDQPFWDTERDMFGLLREPSNKESMNQEEYAANRGRFYLFWNCMKTTGLPVLIALMAGDAAHQAECTPDAEIIAEVMSQLRNVFKQVAVPDPLETIITRWASDKFTRGSYSYVAAEALPGDYDLMAKPVGNLHFAGEATCGTHPATVHGAYLSGLRAASEIIHTILGPISIPTPLVPEKGRTTNTGVSSGTPITTPRTVNAGTPEIAPQEQQTPASSTSNNTAIRTAYDQAMLAAVQTETGPPLPRPARTGLNPFLLYQKDYWQKARSDADSDHAVATGNPTAKAPRDSVRAKLGLMWRQEAEDIKRPYLEQAEVNRQTSAEIAAKWKADQAEWEKKSKEIRKRWQKENPFEEWVVKEMGAVPPPSKKVDMGEKESSAVPTSSSVAPAPGAAPTSFQPSSFLPNPNIQHGDVHLNGTTPGTILSNELNAAATMLVPDTSSSNPQTNGFPPLNGASNHLHS
ncbi:flavin-containing amine oxidoreductase-domain containing protein [Aspergillus unguis]